MWVEIEGEIVGFGGAKTAIGGGGAGACLAFCALMEDELAPLLVGEDARHLAALGRDVQGWMRQFQIFAGCFGMLRAIF